MSLGSLPIFVSRWNTAAAFHLQSCLVASEPTKAPSFSIIHDWEENLLDHGAWDAGFFTFLQEGPFHLCWLVPVVISKVEGISWRCADHVSE
jgi:hypothetical protein